MSNQSSGGGKTSIPTMTTRELVMVAGRIREASRHRLRPRRVFSVDTVQVTVSLITVFRKIANPDDLVWV